MFVASKPENVLIDADYSQIELRLLAHCSEDPNFIDAFENDIDIHKKTATTVFGVKPEDVTPEMRRTAKVVNFGIIYGISDFGLADDLKIGIRHAKKLIDNFYELHPAIDNYMKSQIEKAKQTAYADTIARIMSSISDDLVAAMSSKSNNDMTVAIAQAIAPYALAGNNESVSDVVNKLLRGTPLEQLVNDVNVNI